ncbi:MAG: HEPN domain-containing protein [Oscillospiraceae bacterium]|nr:HEPN domain-containing protein [Oscillospiraceae bacterium]
MSVEENILEWKRLAEMDLVTAQRIFELHRPMPHEIICFHSQQAAEKILKCFLVHNSIMPPKTHDLQQLVDMCAEIESTFNTLDKEAELLSEYGVLPRYPTELELEELDSETALKYADKIYEFVNGFVFH